MKGKNLNIFVRFGGLDLKKQNGYTSEQKTFHSPPASRGFYAMPKVAQEFFLISSIEKTQPSAFPKPVEYDENRSDAESEKLYDSYYKRRKVSLRVSRKEFTKLSGYIWHHLGDYIKTNEVVDRHGSWVKTDIASWERAFSRISLKYRYGDSGTFGGTMSITSINETLRSGLFGFYSRDEFEVFFDEKV
jgi:hypothetical protein